jgi:hypothetical protein
MGCSLLSQKIRKMHRHPALLRDSLQSHRHVPASGEQTGDRCNADG